MRRLVLGDKTISDGDDCYVIAEIGHNHQGDVEKAKEMFRVAKDCGADAVKLQSRDNRSLFTKAMYDSPYDNENSYEAPRMGNIVKHLNSVARSLLNYRSTRRSWRLRSSLLRSISTAPTFWLIWICRCTRSPLPT